MKFTQLHRLLFPDKCLLCGKLLDTDETDLCRRCTMLYPPLPSVKKKIPFLSGCTAVWYYEKDVRDSLLRYKFGRKRHYAQAYARYLAPKLADLNFDYVAWVPVSARRRFTRGYDQVQLLADALCRQRGYQAIHCLRKIRHNRAQAGIRELSHRRANVLGVYRVTCPEQIAGMRILLLDDIITTGSTISECAKTLRSAGAADVFGAAVALAKNYK